MDHDDLMKRVNDTEVTPRPPMGRIPYAWRDFEQSGCYEGSITLAAIKQIFRKLFKKEK